MKHEIIEATLPKKYKLPEPILAICEYHEQHGYPISGCFELSDYGVETLKGWFPEDPETYEQFIPFGRGACGDVYAVWVFGPASSEESPVVMFGSEGELPVLAANPKEFCRLLCLGYSEIGLESPTSAPSDFDETRQFRDFMTARYGFTMPENASSIIDAARQASPDFEAFVTSKQK